MKIVIVGGGTAGWLTAGILAKELSGLADIDLVESTDISTLGVGEGSWPSLKSTLEFLGVDEQDFLIECSASFKQGSRFVSWRNGLDEVYRHPFSIPLGFLDYDILSPWLQSEGGNFSFDQFVSPQAHICANNRAPKLLSMASYKTIFGYGYHFDATKCGSFLKNHCVNNLKVNHIDAEISHVLLKACGAIDKLVTKQGFDIAGDFYIDCSGTKSILIEGALGTKLKSVKQYLWNDRASAVQIPYKDQNEEIQSETISTAHQSGWIWDIGLYDRRGVGIVYSSDYQTQDQSIDCLLNYIAKKSPISAGDLKIKNFEINPGYRDEIWKKNCVAIGMSAGFVEPLEASAIAMIELAAKTVAELIPVNANGFRAEKLNIAENKFNKIFSEHWKNIVNFLKLHYALSARRDSAYWKDVTADSSMPDELQELLCSWEYRLPSLHDFRGGQEIFPLASYLYIYAGMLGRNGIKNKKLSIQLKKIKSSFEAEFNYSLHSLEKSLPSTREYLNHIRGINENKNTQQRRSF